MLAERAVHTASQIMHKNTFSVFCTIIWYKTNVLISNLFPLCVSPPLQVLKESGPPHMKSFLTRVSVGEFSAEGEGNSKKLSKKRAALSILQDLKKLPFIPIVEKPKTHYKKRTKTILKVLQLGREGPGPWCADRQIVTLC